MTRKQDPGHTADDVTMLLHSKDVCVPAALIFLSGAPEAAAPDGDAERLAEEVAGSATESIVSNMFDRVGARTRDLFAAPMALDARQKLTRRCGSVCSATASVL